MFDGTSNFQLAGILLKIHYPKIAVMNGVDHTVSLFFNNVSKIPIINQMISSYKIIYIIFGSGIYHKPYSIFQQNIKNSTIKILVFFSRNDTRMTGYFIGIHRDLQMRKVLLATILSE